MGHTHQAQFTSLAESSESQLLRRVPHQLRPQDPALNPSDEMLVTNTTFRDGQQTRLPYRVEQIVNLYDIMHHLSGPRGIIPPVRVLPSTPPTTAKP
ncbi:hypothetical protein DFAR_1820001 [Desulfarculales bacterium]